MRVRDIPDSLYVACEPYGGDYARTVGNRGQTALGVGRGPQPRRLPPCYGALGWKRKLGVHGVPPDLPVRHTSAYNFHVYFRVTNMGVTPARNDRDELPRRVALRDVPSPSDQRVREDAVLWDPDLLSLGRLPCPPSKSTARNAPGVRPAPLARTPGAGSNPGAAPGVSPPDERLSRGGHPAGARPPSGGGGRGAGPDGDPSGPGVPRLLPGTHVPRPQVVAPARCPPAGVAVVPRVRVGGAWAPEGWRALVGPGRTI
jgi:hypothetical protein